VAYLIAALAGLAFGMADQYLGSLSRFLGGWAAAVSQLAAPWFVLPFIAGMTQEHPRRAAAVGLVVTVAGLLGYFAMTCSPVETIPLEEFPGCFFNLVSSPYNPVWIVGGAVTGPLFGWLGQRWRVERLWIGAALVAGGFCLEPLGRRVLRVYSGSPVVWVAEIAVGVILGVIFAFAVLSARRARRAAPTQAQLDHLP
jgi:hypothetical protein